MDLKSIFQKSVNLSGMSIYWKPDTPSHSSSSKTSLTLFSRNLDLPGLPESHKDEKFNSTIAEKPGDCKELQYLLGPINSQAEIDFCENPEKHDFK